MQTSILEPTNINAALAATKGRPTVIELCAGAGGQAIGLHQAGFSPVALVEIDRDACLTLKKNHPDWPVHNIDLHHFSASEYRGHVDLVAGGVPCPPFSVAGKQLGKDDERDLFPEALRIIEECAPRAIMLENVKGILSKRFSQYRKQLADYLDRLGYISDWKLLNSKDFGVCQSRARAILLGYKKEITNEIVWPDTNVYSSSVGEVLYDQMSSLGWEGATNWRDNANKIAPTIVGGSKKHGGPDLGPTRAKRAWEKLGVNGKSIAEKPPEKDFDGLPRLTIPMVATLQGFPESWEFQGKKTSAYRQVGNAFPPPVSKAVAEVVLSTLTETKPIDVKKEKVEC